MNMETEEIDRVYLEACLRFADACHKASEAYEKGADMGFDHPALKSTILSGMSLAMKWEKMCLEERIRHGANPEQIKEAENNIRKLEEKTKKYKKILSQDDEFKNT